MKSKTQFIFGLVGLALAALFVFSIICAPKLADNYLMLNAIFLFLISGELVLTGMKKVKKVCGRKVIDLIFEHERLRCEMDRMGNFDLMRQADKSLYRGLEKKDELILDHLGGMGIYLQ